MALGHLSWLNDALVAFNPPPIREESDYNAFKNLCGVPFSKEAFPESSKKIDSLLKKERLFVGEMKERDFLLELTKEIRFKEIPPLFKQIIHEALDVKNFASVPDCFKEHYFQKWVTKFFYLTNHHHLNLLNSVPDILKQELKKPMLTTLQRGDFHITLVNYTEKKIEVLDDLCLLIDDLQPLKMNWNHFFKLTTASCTLIFFEFLGQLYMHTQDLQEKNIIKRYAFIVHEDKLLFSDPFFFEKAFEVGEKAVEEFLKCKEGIDKKNVEIERVIFRKFSDTSLDCFDPEEKKECLCGLRVDLKYEETTYAMHTVSGHLFLSKDLELKRQLPAIHAIALEALAPDIQKLLNYVPKEIQIDQPTISQQIVLEETDGIKTLFEFVNYTDKPLFFNSFRELFLGKKKICNSFQNPLVYNNNDCQLILFEYLNCLHMIEKDISHEEQTLNIIILSEKDDLVKSEMIDKEIFKNVLEYGHCYIVDCLNGRLSKISSGISSEEEDFNFFVDFPKKSSSLISDEKLLRLSPEVMPETIESHEIILTKIYLSDPIDEPELGALDIGGFYQPSVYTIDFTYREKEHIFRTSDKKFREYCELKKTQNEIENNEVRVPDIAMSCVIS